MTAQIEHAPVAPIIEAFAGQLTPPPERNAGQWADANRWLPEGTARPGPWRTDVVPYTWAIYEAFSDPELREIIVWMGAQMSKTEIILNVAGHRFDDGPYVPCLYVGPTQKQVSGMSRDRVAKMIHSTPSLLDKLAKGQEDKIAEKWLGGIRWGFAWAGSPTELASWPAGLVLVDERDRMVSDVGGEGDPVGLARARLATYYNGKLGVFSTGTVEGASPIATLYEKGSMLKWGWHCKHCAHLFVPQLQLLIYDKDKTLAEIEADAVVVCPECGGAHTDSDKHTLNAGGRYVPHKLNANGEHVRITDPVPNKIASFWVSGLASPFVSFGERAAALAAAYASRDPDTIQTVINTDFGELYRVSGEAPDYAEVLALKTPAKAGTVPSWAQLVTMGSDVQRDGIFYVIRAWGPDNLSQLVRHAFIAGNTAADDVWLQWLNVLNQLHEGRYLIDRCFVDSGYNPGRDRFKRPEHKVYNACRRTQMRAMPSKGYNVREKPLEVTRVDVNSAGRTIAGGVMLWRINTDYYKTWLHSQVRLDEGVAPNWLLHAGVDVDYCKQIVAEELVVKPSGKRIWVCPSHRPNHYLDCEVLAKAAADSLQAETIGTEFVAPKMNADDKEQEFINVDDDGDFFARYD